MSESSANWKRTCSCVLTLRFSLNSRSSISVIATQLDDVANSTLVKWTAMEYLIQNSVAHES